MPRMGSKSKAPEKEKTEADRVKEEEAELLARARFSALGAFRDEQKPRHSLGRDRLLPVCQGVLGDARLHHEQEDGDAAASAL